MKSKTKFVITDSKVKQLFERAGLTNITNIKPLSAGQYNAVYEAISEGKSYVIKIAPDDNAPILTYEKDIMKTEIFWYKQIAENTDIKIPKVYFFDETKNIIPTNYFIMEKLEGKNPNAMSLSKAESNDFRQNMAQMAAKIHKIKNDKCGYIQCGLYDDWYSAIRSMIVAVHNDCNGKGRRTKRGEKLLYFVDNYKDILQKAPTRMVNFDIWGGNILCTKRENGKIDYVWIDPERSFWGDPISDLVSLEFSKPLEKKTATLLAYNSVAETPIEMTRENMIRYNVMVGYLALIVEAEKYYRYTPTQFGWWQNVFTAGMLYNSCFKVLKKLR